MEKITLKFSGSGIIVHFPEYTVVLTMDETGKHSFLEVPDDENLSEIIPDYDGGPMIVELPKRVMKAFTERAIDRILSKDEISADLDMIVLDGNSYTIVITKGDLTKEYDANDCSIETYPLLRYLASWYRREMGL